VGTDGGAKRGDESTRLTDLFIYKGDGSTRLRSKVMQDVEQAGVMEREAF